MGIDVTHIVKHPRINVDDDAECNEYCERICMLLKEKLKNEGEYRVHKDSGEDEPGCWGIIIPNGNVGHVELILLSDFWQIESFYNYRQILFVHEGRFWLRELIFRIIQVLDENEAWHAKEYLTWNSDFQMGDDCHQTFDDWLQFAKGQYGKEITDFKPQEWLAERERVDREGGVYKEEEEIYHDTFTDIMIKKD